MVQCTINREAWNSLPEDLQQIVEIACQAINLDMMADYTAGNSRAMANLVNDPNVEILRLPDSVLSLLKRLSESVITELAESNHWAARIKESFDNFQKLSIPYQEISELAALNTRRL